MLTDTLTTPRLRAHRPTTSDAPFLRALFAEPAVAATLWPAHLGGPRSARQADALLHENLAHWDEHGFGPWILTDRETREPIGRGGLERSIVQGEDGSSSCTRSRPLDRAAASRPSSPAPPSKPRPTIRGSTPSSPSPSTPTAPRSA